MITSSIIKRLQVFDFDGTLCDSPLPEIGKKIWKEKTGVEFPYVGWWSKPESLDLNVFDIQLFPSVLNQFNREKSTPDTMVIILTSRLKRLTPQIDLILQKHGVSVDKIDAKYNELTKGEKILEYISNYPELEEISVFDDRQGDIDSYVAIKDRIPEGIKFNIYLAEDGKLSLIDGEPNLSEVITEEIENFFGGIYNKK